MAVCYLVVRNNRGADEEQKQTDRRSVLKAGAVGLATLATSGTAFAASNRSDKASDVHAAKGAVGNPVSEQRRKQLRKRAVAEYERNTGETMDGIPAARPEAGGVSQESSAGSEDAGTETNADDEGEVVAFAYSIDADGVAHSYIGMASESDTAGPNNRAEGLIHNRFENRVRQISTALEASDDDVTTEAAGGTINDLENMEERLNNQHEFAKDPYGVVSSTYYWLQDTEYDDSSSLYAFHSPMTIEPGHIAFDTQWKNDEAWNKHHWDENEMAWQNVGDGYWKPAGPSDGGSVSQSYSVSVTAGWMTADVSVGYSWSYTEPAMERTDQSSQYNDYNQWYWNVQDQCDGSVRKSTLSMQPSSSCEMEDYDSDMGERDICFNEVRGRFVDGICDNWYELYSNLTYYKY